MPKLLNLAIAALLFGVCGQSASADALFNVAIEGATSSGGPYSANLQIQANTTYYYEVVVTEAPLMTHNNTGAGVTITSMGAGDGVSSLSFNINDSGSSPIPVSVGLPTLVNGFSGSPSNSAGTVDADGDGVSGIRPIQAAGVFSPFGSVVLTGSFETGANVAAGLTSELTLSYADFNSGFKINGGTKSILASIASETGVDPYISYTGLTLSSPAAAVPEPASMLLMAIGCGGLAGVRAIRRRMIS